MLSNAEFLHILLLLFEPCLTVVLLTAPVVIPMHPHLAVNFIMMKLSGSWEKFRQPKFKTV